MPGFNVVDLIENSVRQPSDRMERWNNVVSSCDQQNDSKRQQQQQQQATGIKFTNDSTHQKPNGYDGLVNLIRNVFHHHYQHHHLHQHQQQQQQPLQSTDHAFNDPKTNNHALTCTPDAKTIPPLVTFCPREAESATGIRFNLSGQSESNSDPMAWQRLFCIYPELADYFNSTAYGTCPINRSTEVEPSQMVNSSEKHKSTALVNDRSTDCMSFGLPSKLLTSVGQHPNHTTPMSELTSWWEAPGMNELFGPQAHRGAPLYVDPRNLTMNYCNSMLGSSNKSTLFFPPDLRKPKRIRTAFSPAQLFQLETTFERNHYVVGQERKDLAAGLGLTETQVKVWFQNRRTKYKRMRMDDPDQSNSTCGAGPESPYVSGSGNHSDEGLDLSNDRMHSRILTDSLRPSDDRDRCSPSMPAVDSDGSTEQVDKVRDPMEACNSHFDLERLFHCGSNTETSTEQDKWQRPDRGPGTKSYSRQTTYTSDHLAYATHTINSHLFGVSS